MKVENEPTNELLILKEKAWEQFTSIREEYPSLDIETMISEAVEQIFPAPYPSRMLEIGLSAINELAIQEPQNLPKKGDCSAANILRFKLEECLEAHVREKWCSLQTGSER